MKSVSKVLVGKDVARGTPATLRALAEGAIAIYDQNMSLLAPGATRADAPSIYIARGNGSTGTDGPLLSDAIHAKNVTAFSGKAYNAGTKKEWFIGHNATSGDVAKTDDEVHSLTIAARSRNETIMERLNETDRYYYNMPATGGSEAAMLEQLAKQIVDKGAEQKNPVVVYLVGTGAAGASTTDIDGTTVNTIDWDTHSGDVGLKIVAENVNQDFMVAINSDTAWGLADATDIEEGDLVYSFGSYLDIKKLLEDHLGQIGHTNRIWFPFVPTAHAESAETYNVYTIQHEERIQDEIQGGVASKTLFICIPTACSAFDVLGFETILNGWMESCGFDAVNL